MSMFTSSSSLQSETRDRFLSAAPPPDPSPHLLKYSAWHIYIFRQMFMIISVTIAAFVLYYYYLKEQLSNLLVSHEF